MSDRDLLDVSSLFTTPLFDLGEINTRLLGILAPAPDRHSERVGISEVFLSEASRYHDLYTATDHFRQIIENAISLARPKSLAPLVLDVGSGSGGNSVAPLLQVFPEARIVATDLSPNLLALLQTYVLDKELQDRVKCVCVSADRDYFVQNSFDIVFGGSILHHIINPVDALKSTRNSLRNEGIAIFAEPFEAGHAFLATSIRHILADNRVTSLAPLLIKYLRDLLVEWDTRIGRDKSDDKYKFVDDKWLFTEQYVKDAASECGLELVGIVPHDHGPQSFRTFTFYNIVKFAPTSAAAFPEWVWAHIDELDQHTSDDLKRQLMFSGTIVLRKP